jgi:hypothetical protein
MKLLQIQSSGDEFFLPDNEVKSLVQQFYDLFRYFLGCILERFTSCYWWFIFKVFQTIKFILMLYRFLNRRLANADHSFAGHEFSLFFSMRSFYLSIYDVS